MSNRRAIGDEFDPLQVIYLAAQVMKFVVSRSAGILPANLHFVEIAKIAGETPALRRAFDTGRPFHPGEPTNRNSCG
jgi:hypothetical protein